MYKNVFHVFQGTLIFDYGSMIFLESKYFDRTCETAKTVEKPAFGYKDGVLRYSVNAFLCQRVKYIV